MKFWATCRRRVEKMRIKISPALPEQCSHTFDKTVCVKCGYDQGFCQCGDTGIPVGTCNQKDYLQPVCWKCLKPKKEIEQKAKCICNHNGVFQPTENCPIHDDRAKCVKCGTRFYADKNPKGCPACGGMQYVEDKSSPALPEKLRTKDWSQSAIISKIDEILDYLQKEKT